MQYISDTRTNENGNREMRGVNSSYWIIQLDKDEKVEFDEIPKTIKIGKEKTGTNYTNNFQYKINSKTHILQMQSMWIL